MAIVGDLAGFKRAQKAIDRAAKGDPAMMRKIQTRSIRLLKDLVKEQFAKGIGPDGSPNRQRKIGGPALKSEKLARGALDARIQGDAIVFFAKDSAGRLDKMLEGHQAGVVFPPRKAGGQWLKYNARGKLVGWSKFVRASKDRERFSGDGWDNYFRKTKTGKLRKTASRVRAQDHVIGRRVLDATPIYPAGAALSRRWDKALEDAAEWVLQKWADSVATADEKLFARWQNLKP